MPNPRQDQDRMELTQAVNEVFIFKTKSLLDYPPEYRQTICDAYRFSATRYDSGDETKVSVTTDTLDII